MNSSVIISNISKIIGLVVYFLLFAQIFANFARSKFGKRDKIEITTPHVFVGAFAYLLALLHPIFYLLSIYLADGRPDPYVAFVNVCLICKTAEDYFLTLGRISFWLLSFAFFAAIFRKMNSWFIKNWKYIHLLNYVAFLIVGLHGFLLGEYFRILPILIVSITMYVIVLFIFVFYKLPEVFKNFKKWLDS